VIGRIWFWSGLAMAMVAGGVASGFRGASAAGFAYISANALWYSWQG
jgi:hypothetical protein